MSVQRSPSGREYLDAIIKNKENSDLLCLKCILLTPVEWQLFDEDMVGLRNCLISVDIIHFIVTLIAIGLTTIRRSVLAMLVNIFLLIVIAVGTFGIIRFALPFVKFHVWSLPVIIIASIIVMIAQFANGDDKEIIFIINSPIIFDIGLSILVWYLYYKYIKKFERSVASRIDQYEVQIYPNNVNPNANNGIIPLDRIEIGEEEKKDVEINMGRGEVIENRKENMNMNEDVEGPNIQPRVPSPPALDPEAGMPNREFAINRGNSNRRPSSTQCIICFENNRDSVCYPCGHSFACLSCANKLKTVGAKCAICRTPLKDIIRLHIS